MIKQKLHVYKRLPIKIFKAKIFALTLPTNYNTNPNQPMRVETLLVITTSTHMHI